MDFSLKVATKTDSKTIVKEYAPIMTAADYVTNRTNSPGKFTFSTVEDKGIDIELGSCVYVNEARHLHGDPTSLAHHERLTDLAVAPREKQHPGPAAREPPRLWQQWS